MFIDDFLTSNQPPSLSEILRICKAAEDILCKEDNVVFLRTPLTIVGDLHGQYFDLKELFYVGGDTSYLFLGDFVDRGMYSIETLFLLLSLKVRFPTRITLLRGNHETRQITQVYGFYDEIIRKYGNPEVWVRCTNLFDCLPLAAVVSDSKCFAVHAGLSPSLSNIDELLRLDRFREIPNEGVLCDLLWSDPADDTRGWGVSPRGAGYVFGDDVAKEFNRENDLKLIARSHQLVLNGFQELFHGNVTTIWSAPNYMNRCGNAAAFLRLGEE